MALERGIVLDGIIDATHRQDAVPGITQHSPITPDETPPPTHHQRNFTARLWDVLHVPRVENENNPAIYIIPSSPHVLSYYGLDFYRSLSRPHAAALETGVGKLVDSLTSHNVEDHAVSSAPINVNGIQVITKGATTIARKCVIDLLYPGYQEARERAKRTALVTTLDQFLAGYFAIDQLKSLRFNGISLSKYLPLIQVNELLSQLKEGSKFQMEAEGNKLAEITILPLPPENGFKNPRFCLIGPEEVDFKRLLEQSRGTRQSVIIQAKKNQLELGLAYLKQYNPKRIVVAAQEGSREFKVYREGYQTHFTSRVPDSEYGLDFWVIGQDGDVDGIVRETQNSRRKMRNVAGCVGIDVVQTGRGMKENRLREMTQILPIPCHAVKITVVRN